MTAGLTQQQLARAAGVSQQQLSNTERGRTDTSLIVRCQLAAACGHELGWKLHPVASVRLRDSGQMELAQTIVVAAHRSWHARLEVPISPGDLRAADLVLTGPDEILHIEIERALVDFQAQLRSAQLKREAFASREERPIRLVIAVPDAASSRSRLAPFAALVSRSMTRSSRQIWHAIGSGEPLGGGGILFVRRRRTGGPDKARR